MSSDAALMEASLVAVAEAGVELRHGLFGRFFDAYPERRAAFLVPEAASRRMTDETLQILLGLATDERWVWPLVAELAFTHRGFGDFPLGEYEAFIDMAIDEVHAAAPSAWSPACDAAWRRQASRFKDLVRQALTEVQAGAAPA